MELKYLLDSKLDSNFPGFEPYPYFKQLSYSHSGGLYIAKGQLYFLLAYKNQHAKAFFSSDLFDKKFIQAWAWAKLSSSWDLALLQLICIKWMNKEVSLYYAS